MFTLNVEHFGDMAVVECAGRIVQSDAAYRLRNAVIAEADARIVILDLSEVEWIEGGGLGMLVYLQRWASDRYIRFKIFNPSRTVRERIDRASVNGFDVASLDEMTALLIAADQHYAVAG